MDMNIKMNRDSYVRYELIDFNKTSLLRGYMYDEIRNYKKTVFGS